MDNKPPAGRGRGRGVRPMFSAPGSSGTVAPTQSVATAVTQSSTALSDVGAALLRTTLTGLLGDSLSSRGESPIRSESSDRIIEAEKPKKPLMKIMQRVGYGTSGMPMELRVNYFRLAAAGESDGNYHLFQYRIEVTHERKAMKPDELREIFWETLVGKFFEHPWLVIYDGGNAFYSRIKLKLSTGAANFEEDYMIALSNDVRRNKYHVKITFVGELIFRADGKTDDPLSGAFNVNKMLDLLFRQYNTLPDGLFEKRGKVREFTTAGRSCYLIPRSSSDVAPLGRACEAWRGYFAASKLCVDGGLYLNFDTAYTPFYAKRTLLDFLCETLNTAMNTDSFKVSQLKPDTVLSEQQVRIFEKELKGVKIIATHFPAHHDMRRRTFKVKEVTATGSFNITFHKRPPLQQGQVSPKDQTGEEVNVAKHFADTYRPLSYPMLPCVKVGSKNKEVFFPLEVCELYRPQKYNKKLSDQQTAAMIKAACTDAPTREKKIKEMFNTANLGMDPFLDSFGVKVHPDMARCKGRRLETPQILYGNDQRANVRDGVWSVDRQRFYQPSVGPQVAFALISFLDQKNENALKRFCEALRDTADQLGIRLFGMPQYVVYVRGIQDIEVNVKDLAEKHCTFYLFALDRRNSQIYAEIKRVGDVVYGSVTQCVLARAINACQPMTLSNIVLKINAKFGGINNMINSSTIQRLIGDAQDFMMIMGIDVTHPGPTDRHSPSIAAVVASIDPTPARYGASIKVQKYRREGLVYVSEAIRERIFDFYQKSGAVPKRILIYRDGVSEGQFSDVLNEEFTSVRKACMELSPNFRPTITFVIVQKRHHTRFFCANEQQACGKARNIPPGTIVDNNITHPTNYDFFLCSHFGIQGTSRPTHYHVLVDENNFGPDDLQHITYQLCHMYARCTRSVSIPAPVYYAHLACARARFHLFKIVGDDSSSSHSGDATSVTSDESLARACRVNDLLRDKMYFC